MKITFSLLTLLLGATFASAGTNQPSDTNTPISTSAPLRELSADRPDATESAQTVDSGHWQLETSVIDYRKNEGLETFTFLSSNLKYGINDSMDLQFLFDAYTQDEANADGFGDLGLRLKWNLWGNDKGNTALALLPFVSIPTHTGASSGNWEGGLAIPFSVNLNSRLSLGLMPEFRVAAAEESGNEFHFFHTAVLGLSLSENLGCYLEYAGLSRPSAYEAYSSFGFTYLVHSNFMIDLGAQIGLNDDAEDQGIFVGFTFRL